MKKFLFALLMFAAFIAPSCANEEKETPALVVAKVDLAGRTLDEVFATITPDKIACCNWAAEFPNFPYSEFRAFHTGDKFYVRFDVKEDVTFARVAVDNGDVWTDSSCELYLSLDGTSYYTIEMNCIGYMLDGYYSAPGATSIRAGEEILSQVERITTLGTEAFGIHEGDLEWSLTMVLPTSVFHQHDI